MVLDSATMNAMAMDDGVGGGCDSNNNGDASVVDVATVLPEAETEPGADQQRKSKCYICQALFTSERELDNHLVQHANLVPYQCGTCGIEGFIPIRSMRAINKHFAMHDAVERRFKCCYCELRFLTERNLKSHVRLYHRDGERNIKTPTASTATRVSSSQLSSVAHHNRTTAAERSFQCCHCGSIYTSPNALKRHENTHTLGVKYVCKVCGKVFAKMDCLAQHDRIHRNIRPYKCDQCGKSFIQLAHLRIHKRHHTGERPHICAICNRGFRHKTGLRTHMRTHSGEKPYRCAVCATKFGDAGTLRKHAAVHSRNFQPQQ